MRVSPGSSPTFYAAFTDDSLNPKDAEIAYVDIFDAEGAQVVSNAVPVHDSVGNYHYTYVIAPDAPQGLWRIEWQAVLNGRNAFGTEEFEVALAGILVNPSDMALHGPLRSRLGEVSRAAPELNGSDTLFLSSEIAEILTLSHNDLDLATLEGWERKAARLSRLIDVAESGTQRTLSQKFDQAKQMVDHWTKMIAASRELRATALAGRVVGKPMNLRDPLSSMFLVGSQPNALSRVWTGSYDRLYATHRLLIPYGWN